MVKHVIPKTYKEALEHLSEGTYKVLAGGTDLMVKNRSWSETPARFKQDMLYIHNLDELRYVEDKGDHLTIGALTDYETLLRHEAVPKVLKDCLIEIAGPAIRKVGTLAGNIGNASPAADGVLLLYLLDAQLVIERKGARREALIDDVITGPGKTTLSNEEMIKEIRLPKSTFTKTQFLKVGGRKADAISKVAFAGAVRIEDGIVKDLRMAIGAVNVTVVRLREVEKLHTGETISAVQDSIVSIKNAYVPHIKPIDDQRSNRVYRKRVAFNMIEDFIMNMHIQD